MKYLSVAQTAKKWGVSERTVRNYCAAGKIPDAFLTGQNMEHSRNGASPGTDQQKERRSENVAGSFES